MTTNPAAGIEQAQREVERAKQRLASAVRAALSLLEQALAEAESFDPLSSRKVFRCHLSDIGEARFLPELMTALHRRAPGVRVECQVLAHDQITQALDTGTIDFAIGFLPSVNDVRRAHLLDDRYVVLLREGHPFVRRARPESLNTMNRLTGIILPHIARCRSNAWTSTCCACSTPSTARGK